MKKNSKVKEEEVSECGVASPGGRGVAVGGHTDGGGGKGGREDTKASTPTDEDFTITDKTNAELTRDMSKLRTSINREIQRRRDLEDEIDVSR